MNRLIKEWDEFEQEDEKDEPLTYGDLLEMDVLKDPPELVERFDHYHQNVKNREVDFKFARKFPGGFFIDEWRSSCLFVFNERKELQAIIGQYELTNPFYFNGIIVLPGHDTVKCYDVNTQEIFNGRIR